MVKKKRVKGRTDGEQNWGLISSRLNPETHKRFHEECRQRGCKMSPMLSEVLEWFLDRDRLLQDLLLDRLPEDDQIHKLTRQRLDAWVKDLNRRLR